MQENYIDTRHGRVYYWQSDDWNVDRETMIFLHGLIGDHTMFIKQVEYFRNNYNVILWDAPAHGKSRPYQEFTYAGVVDVLKAILEKYNLTSVIMVGQSMGGFIVQSFLIRYPNMVSSFIAIDTTPYGEEYYSKYDKWWLRQVEWMLALYPFKAMKKAIAKQVAATTYGYENMLSMLAQYTKKELCHLMGIGYAGFLSDNTNLKINCPVLIMIGEKDKLGKVQRYNKAWVRNTRFPFVVIKNASHNSNVDNPNMVNEEIWKFLNAL
jgi:pimeloyl-ACP methyl ester carboxylesterase